MRRYLTNPARRRQYLLALVDGLLVVLVFLMAYALRIALYEGGDLSALGQRFSWLVIIAVAVHWMTFYLFELYSLRIKRSNIALLVLITLSVLVATGLISVASYLVPSYRLGRVVLSLHIPVMVLAIYLWRLAYRLIAVGAFASVDLAVIGDRGACDRVSALIRDHGDGTYRLVACVSDAEKSGGGLEVNGQSFPGGFEAFLKQSDTRTIVVDDQALLDAGIQQRLIDLKYRGADVFDYPTFFSTLTGRIPASEIRADWLLFAHQDRSLQPFVYLKMKQLLDVSLALAGLALAAPFMLLIAALVKATSRGPVLFRQERLGQHEAPFTLFKFRTMAVDAEERSGPVWASENDPRVTPAGRFLRTTHLDELPQLFNILRGEMSFVGPRPIRKFRTDRLAAQFPFYRLRFAVKPGITGWAQVNGDYAGSDAGQLSKLEYELFYIKNQSIFLDLFIIFKTITTVIARRGA
jgi:exopolysaccharide biosynthesis polyprenyl glycosylphosphotransferase